MICGDHKIVVPGVVWIDTKILADKLIAMIFDMLDVLGCGSLGGEFFVFVGIVDAGAE